MTGSTDDAAELIAGLGPHGRFDSEWATLSGLAAQLATMKEYHQFGWLKNSATITQVWGASMLLLEMLEREFLSGHTVNSEPVEFPNREQWQTHYFATVHRMQESGIRTIADLNAGAGIYNALREQWDGYLVRLGPAMLYDPDEIYPAIGDSKVVRLRPPSKRRLHGVY